MVTVHLDDDLVAVMQDADEPLDRRARELIVIELYRRGTISRGKAAELLGMALRDFLQHASDLGIPYITMTDEEWGAERARIDAWVAGR
jgi:predicted HTH domain antitoxin